MYKKLLAVLAPGHLDRQANAIVALQHSRTVRNAASLTALRVTCHADAADVIATAADVSLDWTQTAHPWGERVTAHQDGTVTIDLSGIYLAKVLQDLNGRAERDVDPAIRAISMRLYDVLAKAVADAGPGPHGPREVRIDGNVWEHPTNGEGGHQ